MRLYARREYVTRTITTRDAILWDIVVPWLGITVARYVGRRFGIRTGRRRLAVDMGRFAFLFWGFAPKVIA